MAIVFWFLVMVAIMAAGGLSRALAAEASPAAGLGVAASGITLVAAAMLALRILRRLDER